MLKIIFWGSLFSLCYTFAGYGLGIVLLGKLRRRAVAKAAPAAPPFVSVVVVAHNEERRIGPRVQNLLAAAYPPGQMEILVVSDGSTDATNARVREISDARVRLLERPERTGKAACLNAGVAAARGEIIVFADARQRFEPETIHHLVSNFSDPRVGAASGNNNIEPSASNVGGGVDIYWRMEKFLRLAECWWDSSIGCTGAIYSIRRKLFTPMPEDTYLDDVVIPMQIALQGHRIVFDPAAKSYDPQQNEPAYENVRKQRTLAGNFQIFFRYPEWLLPWRNRLWWQLLSHKYLRVAAPAFMALLFAANAVLIGDPYYRLLFAGQCAFYGLALIGRAFSSLKLPCFSIPAGFVFLNVMTVKGFWYYLRPPRRGGWNVVRPPEPARPPRP
ncbi:MAG: glycosyltransferase family 2 protein [Verrucomicrobia bacterium]|nr:glycosyltransferase family 2 protein [Verrucomicrobiota bacterium]